MYTASLARLEAKLFGNNENLQKKNEKMTTPIDKKWKVQLLNHPFFSIGILHNFQLLVPQIWL